MNCMFEFIFYFHINKFSLISDHFPGLNQYYAVKINGPPGEKTCLLEFANNTGPDQPAHPHSLISTFVIHFLESTICKLPTVEISLF